MNDLTLVVADRVLHQLGCGPTPESAAYTCPRCRTAHLTITSNGAGPTFTCQDCGDQSDRLQIAADGLPNGRSPKADYVVTVEVLRDKLKLPELERIVKHGRRGNSYELHLKGGRVVALGAIDGLISQAKFRAAFIPQVRRNPPRHKPADWDDVVEMIEQIAEERDAVVTDEDEAAGWIAGYTAQAPVLRGVDTADSEQLYDLLGAGRGRLPPFFDRDGRLHLRLEDLVQWLGRQGGVYITSTALSTRLSQLDFERKRIGARWGGDLRRAWYVISPANLESDLR